jgi:hypothetical protein
LRIADCGFKDKEEGGWLRRLFFFACQSAIRNPQSAIGKSTIRNRNTLGRLAIRGDGLEVTLP